MKIRHPLRAYRVAKTQWMPYLHRHFPQKSPKLVALLRKMTCNLRHLFVFATL